MSQKNAPNRLCLFLLLSAVALFLAGCSLHGGGREVELAPHEYGSGVGVIKAARSQIGVKYKNAGQSPDTGFDCSGLVCWAYERNGIKVPRITSGQLKTGVAVPRGQMKPGDIVLFRISKKGGLHSGIYTGGNMFVHSPRAGERVREESMDLPYWKSRFLAVRRPTGLRH